MTSTLIVEATRAALLDDHGLVAATRTMPHWRRGDILRARVRSIDPMLDAAFVILPEGPDGFLPREGKLPPEGAELLVQVTQVARADKGPKLTTRLQITGARLALTPVEKRIGWSSHIGADQRPTIAAILPSGPGWLVRRQAALAPIDALAAEAQALAADWQRIAATTAAGLIWRVEPAGARLLWDEAVRPDQLVLADPAAAAAFMPWAKRFAPDLAERATRARADQPPWASHFIDEAIAAALSPVVELSGGGRLIVQSTAALTAIDIDSAGADPAAVNASAIAAIAREVRLRALGGLIVVDLLKPADAAKTLRAFKSAFANDPATVTFGGLTRLGLFELAREHRGETLARLFEAS